MKCIHCGLDSGKKAREQARRKCPQCRHPFVTDPDRDKVTDRLVQNAERAVSGNGAYYYLPAHLRYEILRRYLKKKRTMLLAGLGCLSVLLALFMVLAVWQALPWPFTFITVALMVILVWKGWIKPRPLADQRSFAQLTERWQQVNPSPKCLSASSGALEDRYAPRTGELGQVSFDRVLICDRDDYAAFLLANLFHFHYACPVLSGNGYPRAVCADMLRRLKTNPGVTVFLLHDLSPSGLAFATTMKTDPYWFGGLPKIRIIDLGLIPEQRYLFARLSVLLRQIPHAIGQGSYNPPSWGPRRIPTLPRDQGAELSVLRPERLMQLCGAALHEGQPFHLLNRRSVLWEFDLGYG